MNEAATGLTGMTDAMVPQQSIKDAEVEERWCWLSSIVHNSTAPTTRTTSPTAFEGSTFERWLSI